MLTADQIAVSYRRKPVLFDVSVQIPPGKLVVLLGHNGAGKSTLLRALSGLMKVQSGQITFEGRDITAASPAARVSAGLRLVPQATGVFPAISVEDNLRLAAHERDRRAAARRIDQVFDLFPVLRDRRRDRAGVLSGGQQRIVALAMGVVCRPRLLLLDEPCAGLSPDMVSRVLDETRRIKESLGIGVVLCEQHVRQALGVAEHVYVMAHGGVAAEGTPDRIGPAEDVWRYFS